MSTVTHRDVIDYIEEKYDNTNKDFYEVLDGKLVIKRWVEFSNFNFITLPNGMVFDDWCDLDNSGVEFLPDDIVLNGSLFLVGTKIRTLPVLNIGFTLNISRTDIVLQDGTYIVNSICSSRHKLYKYLNHLKVDGYIFSTGILS